MQSFFSSILKDMEDLQYLEFSKKMLENVIYIKGFIEIESYRENSGKGVNIGYWETLSAIRQWKVHSAHLRAQKYGCEVVYSNYTIKICEVQKGYDFKKTDVKHRNY